MSYYRQTECRYCQRYSRACGRDHTIETRRDWARDWIGNPFPYGKKVAARYIARANVNPEQWPGVWNAVNHNVAGYLRGVIGTPISLDERPES